MTKTINILVIWFNCLFCTHTIRAEKVFPVLVYRAFLKRMTEYLDCYPGYIKLEKFLRCLLGILKFSFLPGKVFHDSGKLIIPAYHLYFGISIIAAAFYAEKDIAQWCLVVAELTGFLQLMTKFISLIAHEDELNQLFLWIRKLHLDHEVEAITNSARKHLKSAQFFTQMVLK